jgi:hypothetical protein
MTDFTDFMDSVAESTVKMLKDRKEVMPTVIIVDTEHNISLFHLMIDKQFFKNAIQEMLAKVNVKFYAFVSEAWYVSLEEEEVSALKLPISENPDRKEALHIMGYSRDGQKLCIWIPFERVPNETIELEKTGTRTTEFIDKLIGNLFSVC